MFWANIFEITCFLESCICCMNMDCNLTTEMAIIVIPSEFSSICRTCLSKNQLLLDLKEQNVEIFEQLTRLKVKIWVVKKYF